MEEGTRQAGTTSERTRANDPYAWLEEVEGEAQLDWVRARNEHSQRALGGERFEQIRDGILEVLDAREKIAAVDQHGDHLYDFWTDAEHERGLWRRTSWESYVTDEPDWEVLIDVDALNAAEGANWVWGGAQPLPHDYRRALVSLSRGGADAKVTREFDLETKSWVAGGFEYPESKGSIAWADTSGNVVFIAKDFGPGSMTTSGYPRTVRRWRRGTAVAEAEEVFAAEPTDMAVGASHDFSAGFERSFVYRARGFYEADLYLVGDDGLTRLEVPRSSRPYVHREWLALQLREPWEVGGARHAAGSLIAINLEEFLAGSRAFETIFAPSETTSLSQVVFTRSHVVLNVLEDVASRLELHVPSGTDGGAWERRDLDLRGQDAGAPSEPLDITIRAVDGDREDTLWYTVTGFLTPTTLARVDLDENGAANLTPLKSLPSYFDADGMRVTQHFATSADGSRIPYFQVTPAGAGGRVSPTLLYGYGGFEISMLPSYSGAIGRGWLARGGVFVVANIRGGGEYGPRWHQAALREKRHRAYEDFAAVAEDLVARGVTDAGHLGVRGGSNGGLLIGNMLMSYPELFAAAVCQVPLLDMQRYSKLLAGASWMAEYGNPDLPEEWEFIRAFSPYHLHDAARHYPPVLFTTSTRDDRVHPGHARKMAALMLGAGDDVTYYENIEGGHGGAASNAQAAFMQALAYEFLWQRIGNE